MKLLNWIVTTLLVNAESVNVRPESLVVGHQADLKMTFLCSRYFKILFEDVTTIWGMESEDLVTFWSRNRRLQVQV